MIVGNDRSIVEKACENWNEKTAMRIKSFSIKKSFSRTSMFDDIYLRYIQFRTLHRRFSTNNISFKMNDKDSLNCDFCHTEEESNEHMLIPCESV